MAITFPQYIVTATSVVSVTTGLGGRYYTTSTGIYTGTSAVHVFTISGFFTVTTNLNVSYLAVGGGGGAGGGRYNCITNQASGGGGAGGFITGTFAALAGTTYTITVGSGGAGGAALGGVGSSGTTSIISGPNISTVRAYGGYGNVPNSSPNGAPGGNTGAGSFAGGQWQGGGGAGGAGAQASGPNNPNPSAPIILGPGGVGLQSSITGASTYYAGGGGAAGWYWGNGQLPSPGGAGGGGPGGSFTTCGTPGTPGTGGGGGAAQNGTCFNVGGSGGLGIVVISYVGTTTATVVTTTTVFTTGTTTYAWSTSSQRWRLTTYTNAVYVGPQIIENIVNTTTNYFDLPSGTTAQRPANPRGGYIRFNTTLNSVEYYSTVTSWTQLPFRA